MKKILTIFAAAVAALTLASCNKDDSVYENNTAMGNEINVTAMMAEDAQTRANAKYATADSLESFRIGIYNGKAADWSANPTTAKAVAEADFTQQTDKTWGDGNTYYWADADYKFYAVAQRTGDKAKAYGSSNISKDGIKFDKRDVVTGEDLIVAYADGKQSSKVTTLKFYHALARVRVAASINVDPNVKLKAKFVKWELKNVSTQGSVTIDGTTVKPSNVEWTSTKKGNVSDNATPSSFLDNSYRIVTGTAIDNEQANTNAYWMNVLPAKDVVATELVATVDFYDANDQKIATRTLTASTADGAAVELSYADKFQYASGYAYTYKIDIKNDGGNDTDGPTGPDDDLDDYKIIIKSITVEKWNAADGGTAKFQK